MMNILANTNFPKWYLKRTMTSVLLTDKKKKQTDRQTDGLDRLHITWFWMRKRHERTDPIDVTTQ